MADYQIGDNLYANAQGRYYRLNNGAQQFEESPFDTMSNKLNQVYDAQRNNQLDSLRQQRDKAVAGFNQQKKDLAPGFQNQRNQADVTNAQNVARLRELMAAQGINASGENLTTQAQMASSRQNALSEIDNNEQTAFRNIDRQIADWNDPSREQSIINSIEAERSGKLADAYQQAQQEIYQRYQDYRNWQMQQEQWALEKKMKELELQKMQQALAAARSGGGGGRRKGSSGGSSSNSGGLTAAAQKATQATGYNMYALEQAMLPKPYNAANDKLFGGARPIF